MSPTTKCLIYLLRRDLRLTDNPILHALKTHSFTHLLPVYIIPPHQIKVSGFLEEGADYPYPEARSLVGRFPRCGPHRARFLAEGLWDLKRGFRAMGSDLIIRVGRMGDVVREMLASEEMADKVGAVWMIRDWASEEMREEKDVERAVKGNVECKFWHGEEMLIHDKDLSFPPKQVSDVFTSFRKTVEPLRSNIRSPYPAPTKLPPLPSSIPAQSHPFVIPDTLESLKSSLLSPLETEYASLPHIFPPSARTAHPFKGGESAAHARVRHLVASGAMSSYKDTRNGLLGDDFSTKLSAFLALGFISARQINAYLVAFEDGLEAPPGPPHAEFERRDERLGSGVPGFGKGENKGTAGVRFELLWRDYMRLCLRKFGDALFSIDGFHRAQQQQQVVSHRPRESGRTQDQTRIWHSLDDEQTVDRFRRFQTGCTGTGLIDASQRELYLTGYTSNRARQNVASFLSKRLRIDWRLGAEWYEYLLIDHDVGSNWGNWQYVSGVGNDPRQTGPGAEGRVFNPVKQAYDYDPAGTYVKTWVEELKDVRPADVDIVFQAWKVRERKKAKTKGDGAYEQMLDRLEELEWFRDPLVRIQFDMRKR